jgi:hypothetical protein
MLLLPLSSQLSSILALRSAWSHFCSAAKVHRDIDLNRTRLMMQVLLYKVNLRQLFFGFTAAVVHSIDK